MNSEVATSLIQLEVAAMELAVFCDSEAPEFAAAWRQIAGNALAAKQQQAEEEIECLVQDGVMMFSYHPDSFMEAYAKRSDIAEMMMVNAEFDRKRKRVAEAFGKLSLAFERVTGSATSASLFFTAFKI